MEKWRQNARHKMKTYRCNLRPVRLLILVCHLGLVLRTEAQRKERCFGQKTYRPPENSDISVVCGSEYMDLNIYLCPVYQALYDESLMVVNKQFNTPECFGTADWTVTPPLLKFRLSFEETSLSSCKNNFKIINQVGTGTFAQFSNVQYVIISGNVSSVDPTAGMITFRPQILYKFSCVYPLQYLMNNTEIAVSGMNLAIRENNGTFISTLSMNLFKDEEYREILLIPETGLQPKTKIYVAVEATNLTDRFNVLLDRCYTSTSPYPALNTYYDLFIGCTRDPQTKVELNGVSQKALFSFEAFRFVEHKHRRVSTFFLHCATRLCEVSSCSMLLPDCSSSLRLGKREAQYVSESVTITSTAILVAEVSPDGLSATDIPSNYHTEKGHEYKSDPPFDLDLFSDHGWANATSSMSCYRIPVVTVIVCNILCFSV